ncbi:hypothetical protein [Mesorhizobium sp. M0243]|uniref:hypothetical protein n=1 Tax=Mesorhizobium sp. M0243 TaxID=2956925 RepID=UPI00333DAF23
MPDWLRRAVHDPQSLAAQGVEDLAIVMGAAIGALDAVVRREKKGPAPGGSASHSRRPQ